MALQDKLRTIENVLRSHFTTAGTEDKTAEIMTKLKDIGGTSETTLSELTPADLESLGLPPLVARRAAKAIGWVESEPTKQIVIVDDNPVNLAARLKPEELVAEYDPNDSTSPFAARLKTISNGNRFLVFKDDGSVNVPVSQKLLRELLDGYTPRTTVMVDGKPEELFAVGERPARYADENPAVAGQMIRPDGFSDANIEWGSVALDIRQLVHLAVKGGESKKCEVDLFDDVAGKDFNTVARRFPQAAIQFEKLKGAESLPSLKLVLQPKTKAA